MPKKKYTQAEWARIQSRLPEEDREPYSSSPEIPTLEENLASLQTFAGPTATSKAEADLKAAQADKLIAQQAKIDAAKSAGYIASITGATIDPKTGLLTPPKTVSGKTVTSVTYEGSGKNRVKVTKYSDGSETREAAPEVVGGGKKLVSTYIDPTTGDTIGVYDDESTVVLAKGTKQLDAQRAADAAAAASTAERKSAYDLLYQQFAKYGLQALVTPLESLIKEGVPASEFAIRLRETDAYQKRFAANKARINKGLAALSEAEYIGLEDQYQNIMRQYGMPESYYARGEMGKQEGFEKLIAGDVSAAELETRVSSAYNRVINANPEVIQSLKSYYPNITNGDILSYVLDPEKALTDINKKITAAEIGGAALGAGLAIGATRAEELGAFGVSKAQAQQGYQTIAELLPTAQKLGQIYAKQGLGFYDQSTAEKEVFGISGAAEAAKKRKQLTQLETAQFSGQVGTSGSALARERAGQF
jgi:hypothetical protein